MTRDPNEPAAGGEVAPPASTLADLLGMVYAELRKLAAARLAREAPGHTLDPTALVHEAYLRLAGGPGFVNRAHFFAAAAEAMRRILVESARRKAAAKHGGGLTRHDPDDLPLAAPEPPGDLLALDDALSRLAATNPDQAELVKLRYFVGMTVEQAADALGISPATAKRRWGFCRAWLFRAVRGAADTPGPSSGPGS